HRQAAKAVLRPWNESGLGRADRPAQTATDSVPAGRANRQAGVDAQCRRLSFVGWSLPICFSFKGNGAFRVPIRLILRQGRLLLFCYYRAAVARPAARITLRQGARVIEDSRACAWCRRVRL